MPYSLPSRTLLIELDHDFVSSYVVKENSPAYFGTHMTIARDIASTTGMSLLGMKELEGDLQEFIAGNSGAGTKYYTTTSESDAAIHMSYMYEDSCVGKHALNLSDTGILVMSPAHTAKEIYRHADYDGLMN